MTTDRDSCPVRPAGAGVGRVGIFFLFGTALAAGVVAMVTLARQQAEMQVGVQVLDGCTVSSGGRSTDKCQAQPEVRAPASSATVGTNGPAKKGSTAAREERTDDGFITFFF